MFDKREKMWRNKCKNINKNNMFCTITSYYIKKKIIIIVLVLPLRGGYVGWPLFYLGDKWGYVRGA